MTRHTRILALTAVIVLDGSACADSVAAPDTAVAGVPAPALSAMKFWDANAAANWTDLATSLSARTPVPVGRLSVYLSLAQLRAAEDAEATVPHPPTSAAIGAASAAILNASFPSHTSEIDAALDAQRSALP